MGELRRTHTCGEVAAQPRSGASRRSPAGSTAAATTAASSSSTCATAGPGAGRLPARRVARGHERAGELRSELVVAVRGRVERRAPDTVNPKLPTGEIEVAVDELRILNRATPPPFPIEEESPADEAVRLRHRIHDLRRPPLQRALRLRHRLTQSVRRTLSELGFLEIETPILAKSTPEGARDFLVPSRSTPAPSTRCRSRRRS